MPEAELKKLREKEHAKAAAGDTANMLSLGLLCLRANADGAPAYTGAAALPADRIIAQSPYVAAVDEQAVISLDLPPGPGTYVLLPTTFQPGSQAPFALTLYVESDNAKVRGGGRDSYVLPPTIRDHPLDLSPHMPPHMPPTCHPPATHLPPTCHPPSTHLPPTFHPPATIRRTGERVPPSAQALMTH